MRLAVKPHQAFFPGRHIDEAPIGIHRCVPTTEGLIDAYSNKKSLHRVSRLGCVSCGRTTAFTCRAGFKERDRSKRRDAGPVKCNAWILMKAFSAIMGAARCRAHQPQEAFTMRTFTPPAGTRFYAGVDLHARALFLVVLDGDGQVRFARNLPAAPAPFLRAIAPFRDGLLVACECMHCWYWLADICRDHDIAFVRGHAYSMKAVHGYK